MSWMKRAQGDEAPGAGPQPPYAAPHTQPYANQQAMYPDYSGVTGNMPQQANQQAQYWPQHQPQYNQQFAPTPHQNFLPNANHQYQQQPAQYNHNYTQPGYSNPQNYYQNQPQMNQHQNQPGNSDGWEDNWDWGWEESAKQAQNNAQQRPIQQQQVFNNANVIEESFAPNNTWNWAMDDKKPSDLAVHPAQQEDKDPVPQPQEITENKLTPELNNVHNVNDNVPPPVEEVRTLEDRDVKENMPNLALGKRFHLDNLTPQWSIESQMSQESSDGPQTHSESTYRSENQSRNSNSPGPNTANSNYNFSQSEPVESFTQNSEWSRQSDELTVENNIETSSRRESHEELAQTMQNMSLVNLENPASENVTGNAEMERRNSQQNVLVSSGSLLPPVGASHMPPSLPRPPSANTTQMQPPLAGANQMPPPPHSARPPSANTSHVQSPLASSNQMPQPLARPPSANTSQLPPPSNNLPAPLPGPPPSGPSHMPPPPPVSTARPPSAGAGPSQPPPSHPPPNFPPPNSQNPFKHAGPFSHKPKPSNSSAERNLTSPAMVGKAAQSRTPVGFEANLETTPDNSERPDHPPTGIHHPPPAPLVPENLEVAPQNDRNEYLQTAHLSSGDYENNTEFAPPPGLRRMVVGRQEEYGLSRMVPGRQTEGDGACDQPEEPYPYRERPDAYRRGDGERTPPEYRGTWRATDQRVIPGQQVDGSDNLQDLSTVSSAELPYAREASPQAERAPEPTRRSSADTDGEPRRVRRDSRSRDPDPRYQRSDRHERDDRKSTRDDRRPERDRRDRRDRDRDESPDGRRKRRTGRSNRYETEDSEYYSDKERDRRRHREGSYASRPPRPEQRPRDRDYDDRERSSRSRRYAVEGRDRYERAYRDIDPERKHGNRRRERDEHRRRVTFSRDAQASHSSRSEGDTYSSPSREATATDEEPERRRERRPRHGSRRTVEPYYDGYGGSAYGDPYLAQRQQYEYYERLRVTDPAAYMQVYKRLMAGRVDPTHHDLMDAYGVAGAGVTRGSVHSGRSSAQGVKGDDTFYVYGRDSPRDAPSLRTDFSDRETTEMSLPPHLETGTVPSERMTPHRFSTAHVKGSISSRHVVVVRPSWPVDGLPATVHLVSLEHAMQRDPIARELMQCPGPLVQGVTHKKSVIEYCMVRVRGAAREGAKDPLGYALLWELLALLLRQNGVVVGTDIAELLMKNTREHEYNTATNKPTRNDSRRESSVSGSAEEAGSSPDCTEPSAATNASNESSPPSVDEKTALDKLRELLLYGNRQEALEWAMSCNQWGHALQLSAYCDRRTRGAVTARFLAALPRADPLHTLYATLAAARAPQPPVVSSEGDWRPHAAIVLANGGARPDHDTRTLTALGDRLAARGLPYCAQFCYVAGGVSFSRHPLAPLSAPPAPAAPPRLSLLLAEPRASTLAELATTRAVLATEIYEYALSLNRDYCIPELQVYKFVVACRLVDVGQYERALAYVEQAARCVTRSPRDHSPLFVQQLADMADRLKFHEPALHEEGSLADEADSEGSPRHQQWLQDVQNVALMLQAEAQQATPVHAPEEHNQYQQQQPLQYSWDQAHQYQQQQQQMPAPVEPEETPDYSQHYYPPPAAVGVADPPPAEPDVTSPQYAYQDWNRTEEHHAQTYGDSTYWQGDTTYGYGETNAVDGGGSGAEEVNPRPMITMPGSHAPPTHSYGEMDDDSPLSHQNQQQSERETDTPKSSRKGEAKPEGGGGGGGKGGGWLGGILTKLSLRPPNQMILPDDKNPTIVWDPDKKCWKNTEGEETEAAGAPPPPPRTADLAARLQVQNTSTPNLSPAGGAAPPTAPVSNIFKMQKGRHIKKAYVDVFNPGGASSASDAAPPPPPPLAPPTAPLPSAPLNYFVPGAAPQINAYELSPEERIHSGI